MTFKNALKLLKPYHKQMAIIMALSVIVSAISVLSPFVNRRMFDNGLLQGNMRIAAALITLLLLLQVGGQFIEYLQRRQEISITNELGKKLKTEAFEHGLKLKPRYFKETGFYTTISNALLDISGIMSIATNSLLTIFVIICKSVGALVGLVILDWRLSLLVVAVLPLKVWLNSVIRKRAEMQSERVMTDNKAYNSWLTNILSGISDVKLWSLEQKTTAEFREHTQTINESSKVLSLLQAKNNLLTNALEYALINALYLIGALLIAREQITLGGLIAFISFAAYVTSPVNIVMQLRIILKQITPNVEGLQRFYALEEEAYTSVRNLPSAISTIEFRNISVAFDGRSVFENFNLTVNAGEKVAIVGENGSGKTTLTNLLLRLCEPDSGEILVNGIPITEFNIVDYRRRFSVVSQEVHLFRGTVADNISLDSTEKLTFADNEALQFCTEPIANWEQQYETQVGSDGAKLSGGERQKIALLRALHRKSEILILDEATSNYDKESDAEFNKYVLECADYAFCFIVTHRREILATVDKVVEL